MPIDQPNAPDWLKNFTQDFQTKTEKWLPGLNDDGTSFEEIADLIEKTYL